MRNLIINPVYIGAIIFLLCFLIGKFGYEGETPDYNITLLYPLFFVLGGMTANCFFKIGTHLDHRITQPNNRLPLILDQIIRVIYFAAIACAMVRLIFIVKFILQGYDLRYIEYNVRVGGTIASVLVQILPILGFYVLLTAKNAKTVMILSIITTISCFAIPIKTHIIAALVIVYLAVIIKSSSVKKILMSSLKIITFIFLFLFVTLYLRSPEQTFEFILDKLWLTFRHYTSFNIANLSLDLDSKHGLTYGLHSFSQIIDTSHFVLYSERFIDRSIGNSGLNSVVDGRKLIVLSPGTNMSTAVRVWAWDFGMVPALLISYIYGVILTFISYIGIKTRFYGLYGIAYLCGVFFFWDFDLFETRFQLIYILFILFTILAYVLKVRVKTN